MSRGPCSDCWTSLIHAYSLILRGMQAKPGLLNTQIIGQNVLETTFLQHTTRNQTWYLLSGCNTKLYMHTLSIYLSVLFTIMLKTSAWELLLFQQFNDLCFEFLSAACFVFYGITSAAISLIVDGRRLYQDTHVHWYQSYSYYLKNEKRLKIETYTYNWYWLHFPVSRVWMNKFICVWQMHIKWWAEGCSFTYGSEKSTWQSI